MVYLQVIHPIPKKYQLLEKRKKMKKIFIIVFLSFFALIVFGQKYTIQGYILDSRTGEALLGAYAYDLNNKIGTATNQYGYYSIVFNNTSNKNLHIVYSFIGYAADTIDFVIKTDTIINIKLKAGKLLKELVINADNVAPIEKRDEVGTVEIPLAQMRTLPAFAGERDIIKAYQLMPGVQSGSELSNGLMVRGGSSDQNLVLLDDVPLCQINHLGGFVSLFNDDAINETKLYKAGFPASYGGRLSSVLDVRMKDGSKDKITGNFTLGLLSSKIFVVGPVKKDTSSYFISYRRFLYDLLIRPVMSIASRGNYTAGYNFYDLNFKWTYRFSNNDNIALSFYNGDDKLFVKFKEKQPTISENGSEEKWGNTMAAFKWIHIYNKKLFGNTVFSFVRYRYKNEIYYKTNTDTSSSEQSTNFLSGVYDLNAKSNFEYQLNQNFSIETGVSLTGHFFKPGIGRDYELHNEEPIFDTTYNNVKLYGYTAAAYGEGKLQLLKNLEAKAGLRLSDYYIQSNHFPSLEPRCIINYGFSKNMSVKLAYSRMIQNMHMLSGTGSAFPIDFWVPAIELAPPSYSNQYVLSYATTLFRKFEFSVEGYYKDMRNLINYKEGVSSFNSSKPWYEKIETDGKGKAVGAELLIQKSIGRSTGWIGYTLSKNERTFTNLNYGNPFPFKFDRRHELKIVFSHVFNKYVDISLTWLYMSGQAYTLPVQKYYDEGSGYLVYLYSNINSFRMAPYHRLDFGVNFRRTLKNGERIWNISLYNVYNQKNPSFYYFNDYSVDGNNFVSMQQITLFPFIPTVSYSFKF